VFVFVHRKITYLRWRLCMFFYPNGRNVPTKYHCRNSRRLLQTPHQVCMSQGTHQVCLCLSSTILPTCAGFYSCDSPAPAATSPSSSVSPHHVISCKVPSKFVRPKVPSKCVCVCPAQNHIIASDTLPVFRPHHQHHPHHVCLSQVTSSTARSPPSVSAQGPHPVCLCFPHAKSPN
jgi:hypothetical protein